MEVSVSVVEADDYPDQDVDMQTTEEGNPQESQVQELTNIIEDEGDTDTSLVYVSNLFILLERQVQRIIVLSSTPDDAVPGDVNDTQQHILDAVQMIRESLTSYLHDLLLGSGDASDDSSEEQLQNALENVSRNFLSRLVSLSPHFSRDANEILLDMFESTILCFHRAFPKLEQMNFANGVLSVISTAITFYIACLQQSLNFPVLGKFAILAVSSNISVIHLCLVQFSRLDSVSTLWNEAKDHWLSLKFACLDALNSKCDSLGSAAIEFLRTIVLLYSAEGVQDIPGTSTSSRAEAEEFLLRLCGCLKSKEFSGVNMSAAVHALCGISRSRPQFLVDCAKTLISLRRRPLTAPAQWGRVLHSLKMNLSILAQFQGAKNWSRPIQESLLAIGNNYRSFRIIKAVEEKVPELPEKVSGVKRGAEDVATEEEDRRKRRKLSSSSVDPKLVAMIHSIPVGTAIESVFLGFQTFNVPELEEFDQRIQEMKQNKQQLHQLLMARRKNPFEGASVLEKCSSRLSTFFNDVLSRAIPDPRLRTKTKEAARQVLDKAENLINSALQGQRKDSLKKLRLSVVPPIPTPQFEDPMRLKLSQLAFSRLLTSEAEQRARESGKASLRRAMICKSLIVTLREEGYPACVKSSRREMVLSFIFGSLNGRLDLGLSLLHCLFTEILREEPWEAAAEYDFVAISLLKEMISLPNSLVNEFIVKAPKFTENMLHFVTHFFLFLDGPQDERIRRMDFGFELLKQIVSTRPKERTSALGKVLAFSCFEDEVIQHKAIEAMVALHAFAAFGQEIDSFVLSQLNCLDTYVKDVENDETMVDRVLRMKLRGFYALCRSNVSLVIHLTKTFAKSSKTIRQQLLKMVSSERLVEGLSLHSPAMIELVLNVPEGGELFLLTLLIPLTASINPPEELVKPIIQLSDKTNNPLFLISVMTVLKKEYLIQLLPNFFSLRDEHLKLLVGRLLNNPSSLSPTEFLVQLHLMSGDRFSRFYEQVKKIVLLSLKESVVQNQQVLGSVLQQLVDRHPLPPLFVRTLMEAIKVYKPLTSFAMGLLARLVRSRVWDDVEIWKDFIRCCVANQPDCYPLLKDLPKNQFSQLLKGGKMVQPFRDWVDHKKVRLSREHQRVLEKLSRSP
eukprot:TRINITY_DN5336_c0_g1_i6.p1 TRINITY_DN5336_c0_g1~~TRINITY_DN5336_c0_g1_i6.p1  ORF type:complete len:1130 (-),score=273.37 TRINITY_DN5336_c0_g1_i6:54-3443(-)